MTTGTVTAAAEQLCVSQPAVSQHISDLERSTGLRLFVREKRRLRPTAEALTLFQEVEHSFAGLEVIRQKARDIKSFNTGNLRIVAIPALSMGFLPRVLREFIDEHPNITVWMQTEGSSVVKRSIAEQQFDLGLLVNSTPDPRIHAEPFALTAGVCVMRSDDALCKHKVVRPQHLHRKPMVALGRNDWTRQRLNEVLMEANVSPIVNIETHLADVVCSFVLDGFGAAVVNPFSADDFRTRGLVVKPFEPSIPIRLDLALPAARPASALVAEFLAILKKHRDKTLARFQKDGLVPARLALAKLSARGA